MNTDHIKEVYKKTGFMGVMGYGNKPAVIVVDFSIGFTDLKEPFGGDYSPEIQYANRVLAKARAKSIPIIFTTVAYNHIDEAGLWINKTRALETLMTGSRSVEIDPRLEVQPNEIVLVKKYASAFAGTSLSSILASKGIDTVLIAGVTTSGCVRATVVDAMQSGFRPIVIKEAVGDRAKEPHEANLFDINSKYGDVRSVDDVIDYINNIE